MAATTKVKASVVILLSTALLFLFTRRREGIAVTGNFQHITEPIIYVITPTYKRPSQAPDLTRMAQTLMHVRNLVWIVVEDASKKSDLVEDILNRTNLLYAHLLGERPANKRNRSSGRGVSNRLKGLEWIKKHAYLPGVLYFADDDNTYDIRLFQEIRETKKVSVFPVGMIADIGVSTPIVKNGKVIGFFDPFIVDRKFPVDMAGFAVNLKLVLQNKKLNMPYRVGYEEDTFIRSLGVTVEDLEALADNCTKVLVWHTKTQPGLFPSKTKVPKKYTYHDTNLKDLFEAMLR